jgi:murein DD-endopeptidase MepM/ murein hydrolase activator NlpD
VKRERYKIGGSAPVSHGGPAPLDLFGADATQIDRRAVNLRWLCASSLTGLTGAALIAAALHVSLQGDVSFAAIPDRAVVVPRLQQAEGSANVAHKGDRLVSNPLIASARQNFRAPVTVRLGDREIIKAKPFVRITTPLSLTVGTYSSDLPKFDPMKFVSDEPQERASDAANEAPGAEVTVVKRDLIGTPIGPAAPALSDDDVVAQVEEERRLAAEVGRRTSIPVAPQIMLSRTLQQAAGALDGPPKENNPFKAIEVLVVPENVTKLPKTELKPNEMPLVEERDLSLARGDTLEGLLRATGAAGDEQIRGIVAALGGRTRTGALAEGQQMRVQIAPGPRPGDPKQVTRVVLFGESGIEGIAAVNDRGAFVPVAPPKDDTPAKAQPQVEAAEDEDEEDSGSGPRLYQSLYETAGRHDIPRATVEDIVRVFSYDIDFQRRVSSGDSLDLFYTYDEEGAGAERPDLLYAALTMGGETRKVYRFQSPDDGSIDYLDEQGRSLKKFLLRKPIADGIMRSGFGYRRHPVLGYAKLHTGVDWSNPIGTPIMAAGNGLVIRAEMTSGYGRRVEIQHINGYVTTYNHMSRFGRGVTEGARVRQGQIIGYVGSTGLSTGAHLHYEVIINGHFVDPMKIRVPRGKELDGRLLADFRRQREQIEGTMDKAKSATALAQRDAAVR